jgi:predicted O-methyltransferase YrrM
MGKSLALLIFRGASRLRIHVLPVHFYSAIPDVRELERTLGIWAKKSQLPGLGFDKDTQAQAMRRICMPFQGEYVGNRAFRQATRESYGPGYGYLEAQALHGVLRHYKPAKVVEVGSGVSTFCMLNALEANRAEGRPPRRFLSIEPHPSPKLRALASIDLVPRKVQEVGLECFEDLGPGDFLFVDSSHAVKPGSDVNFLVLEVLPRLKPGVVVHFHDIFLPYDYSRDTLRTLLFWSETSLLRAFLTKNDHAKVLFCMSYLHYEAPAVLKEVFPEYEPQPDRLGLTSGLIEPSKTSGRHFPSSLYFEITE